MRMEYPRSRPLWWYVEDMAYFTYCALGKNKWHLLDVSTDGLTHTSGRTETLVFYDLRWQTDFLRYLSLTYSRLPLPGRDLSVRHSSCARTRIICCRVGSAWYEYFLQHLSTAKIFINPSTFGSTSRKIEIKAPNGKRYYYRSFPHGLDMFTAGSKSWSFGCADGFPGRTVLWY